jgi:hypothetical protein
MSDQCTEQQFLKDVATHQMTIVQDNGVYRHLQFRRPERSSYWFNIVTWPGALCINGDCGTYVFTRLNDMFEFFRDDRTDRQGLYINKGYWGVKLISVCPQGKYMEFSEERFRQAILEQAREHCDDWSRSKKKEFMAAVNDDVLAAGCDGNVRAYDAALGFEFENEQVFQDFWECRCDAFTWHYVWCCYAIAWGIKQYDAAKAAVEAA